jgi:hypothetical protein
MTVWAVSCLVLSVSAFAIEIDPSATDRRLAQAITKELDRRHLASDTLFSARRPLVGQLILDAIDPGRAFLTEQDIASIQVDALPTQIETGNLDTVYDLYGLVLDRTEQRLQLWLALHPHPHHPNHHAKPHH